ncbi:MAG: MoaD family protein [Methanomicrobiales archaeon]|nr:MoaD family protein [Methanomicrobiales archaeon]
MIVTVRAFARFQDLFGQQSIIELPEGATLRDLLNVLGSRSPEAREALFEENQSLRDYVILMRNRRRVDHAEAAETLLHDGDEIAVFPPVAGG